MLANDFYTITNKSELEGGFESIVKFNPDHLIYKAHFPGSPVTPGVCILQICTELLSNHYQLPLTMISSKNIKFLHILDPISNSSVPFKVTTSKEENGFIKANIIVQNDTTIFAKISATYK